MRYRIFADFNNKIKDELGEKVFICDEESWQHYYIPPGAVLKQGQEIRQFDGEIEVTSTLDFDENNRAWYGRPDWSTLRNLKSRADGLEIYKDANAKQKLEVLKYEMAPLINTIRGYVDLLVTDDHMEVIKSVQDSDKFLSGLSRALNDLDEVLECLTED
jgi:hypothetical protein